jgi:hypothetical protein
MLTISPFAFLFCRCDVAANLLRVSLERGRDFPRTLALQQQFADSVDALFFIFTPLSPHNEPITMGIAKINTTAPVYIGCRTCA